VLALILATGACSGRGEIRAVVPRGTRADSLTIRLEPIVPGSSPAVEAIVVRVRDRGRGRGGPSDIYWYVARRPSAEPIVLPAELRYGVVPAGFAEGHRPVPLPLGRYEVAVKAGSTENITYFRVTTANRIE
jgi:hypothetical protein